MDNSFHLDVDPGMEEYREAAAKHADDDDEPTAHDEWAKVVAVWATTILIISVALALGIMVVGGAIAVARGF